MSLYNMARSAGSRRRNQRGHKHNGHPPPGHDPFDMSDYEKLKAEMS